MPKATRYSVDQPVNPIGSCFTSLIRKRNNVHGFKLIFFDFFCAVCPSVCQPACLPAFLLTKVNNSTFNRFLKRGVLHGSLSPTEVHTYYHWDQGSLLRQRIPCWHQGPWSYQNIHVMLTVAKANRPDAIPAKTRRWLSAVLMLGQRRRRWPNIKTTLGQRLVLAGIVKTTLRAGPTLNQHWFGVYRVWKPIAQLWTPKIDRFIYTGLCSESSHVCNGLRFALGEICNKICSVSATKKIRRSLCWLSCEI